MKYLDKSVAAVFIILTELTWAQTAYEHWGETGFSVWFMTMFSGVVLHAGISIGIGIGAGWIEQKIAVKLNEKIATKKELHVG